MAAEQMNVFDTTHLYTCKRLSGQLYAVYILPQEVKKKEKNPVTKDKYCMIPLT